MFKARIKTVCTVQYLLAGQPFSFEQGDLEL